MIPAMRIVRDTRWFVVVVSAVALALAPIGGGKASASTQATASVEQTLLVHGISASQVRGLRFYAGTVATLLRNGTIDDAQAHNLVSSLIGSFSKAQKQDENVPIEHLPMPNMVSGGATSTSAAMSPLTTTSDKCLSTGCGYFVFSTQSGSTYWNQATAYITLPSMSIPGGAVGNDYGYVMYGAVSGSGYSEDIGLRYTDGLSGYADGWHLFYCVQTSTKTGDNCQTTTYTLTISDPYLWVTIYNGAVDLQVINPSTWTDVDSIEESDSYAGWSNTGSDQQLQQETTIAQYAQSLDDGSTLTDAAWDEAYLYYPSGGYEYYDLWTSAYTSNVWTCPPYVTTNTTSQYNNYTGSVDYTSSQGYCS